MNGIVNWWDQRCILSADRTAVIDADSGERWTYARLNERVRRLAALLQSMGIRRGDRLALLAPNDVAYFEWLFACAKLGAVLVPLNWRLAKTELDYILGDCQPRLIGYHDCFAGLAHRLKYPAISVKVAVQHDVTAETVNETAAYAAELPAPQRQKDLSPDDPYLIIYTGGTTGMPKGVVLSHGSVFWNAANTVVTWQLSEADVTPTYMPMFHTGGMNALSLPVLHAGGTVVVVKDFQPKLAIELLNREKCTIALLVPTMYHMLVQSEHFAAASFPAMHTFVSGGAPCPLPLYEAFEAKGLAFKEGYGLTEAGPNNFYIHPSEAARKRGSVGRPMLYNEVRLADDQGREVPVGEVGEIWLRGGHLFHSYWNRPDETQEAMHEEGWLKTGDLGRRDTDGCYYIVGRKKDMIITGGENVYPLEVEHRLRQHPAVADAAVVGVPDPKWGEAVSAAVALLPGAKVTEEELKAYCAQSLGKYKVPKRFLFLEKLPATPVGKIDKKQIVAFMLQ
ncbi:class I adenylate-forming enzyme family protein [Paenibacillus chartarius]|uniref:Class I adenylate-forming enzyme family protein n=1 Tax=Paenibacillus chartarius TaxID=747481 RepID=A0ABV6DFL8_9BACL